MGELTPEVVGRVFILYLVFISAVTFLLFGLDKYKARTGRWRIPENTLLGLCLIGGTLGGGIAMMVFHHKVSKTSFLVWYYLVVGVQVIALVAWWYYQHYRPLAG